MVLPKFYVFFWLCWICIVTEQVLLINHCMLHIGMILSTPKETLKEIKGVLPTKLLLWNLRSQISLEHHIDSKNNLLPGSLILVCTSILLTVVASSAFSCKNMHTPGYTFNTRTLLALPAEQDSLFWICKMDRNKHVRWLQKGRGTKNTTGINTLV